MLEGFLQPADREEEVVSACFSRIQLTVMIITFPVVRRVPISALALCYQTALSSLTTRFYFLILT